MKKFLFLTLLASMPSIIYSQIEIFDSNIENILVKEADTDKLIILDFYATWCGPCKTMDPILKELSREYKNETIFYKMDIDKNESDDALNVTAVPTYFFIKDGKTLEVVKGARSKDEMKTIIKKYVSNSQNYSRDKSTSCINDELIEKFWYNDQKLNSLAWHIYEKHNEVLSIDLAVKAVKRSILLNQNYYNTDTYAALLYKKNEYNKALGFAKKAIEIAKDKNLEYKSTKNLLKKIIDKI